MNSATARSRSSPPTVSSESSWRRPAPRCRTPAHSTELLSIHDGEIAARNNDLEDAGTFTVEGLVSDASVDDYDALLLPGGTVNPDKLRIDEHAVGFVRDFFNSGKPIGVDLPWAVDARGSRRRPRSHPDVIPQHPDRSAQRRRQRRRRGGGHRRGLGHEPLSRRSSGVLQQDRGGVRRGPSRVSGPRRERGGSS